jgi:hypothetical protein
MTAIVGINWLWEIVLAADTRVSWKSQGIVLKKEDILKKVYALPNSQDPKRPFVLGFSCSDLKAAKAVIVHLGTRKFPNYSRPFIAAHLKEDLRGWIEEVAVTELNPEMRSGLRFMLCGIDPPTPSVVKRNNEIVRRIGMSKPHLYVYTVNKGSGKVSVEEESYIAVIGSGRKLTQEIKESSYGWAGFGGIGKMQWARAHMIAEITAMICKRHQSRDIGGPFQAVCITPMGLITHYVWPPSIEAGSIEVIQEGEKTIVRSPVLEKAYTLHPIWELPI